jgi:hypothetical protein
MGVEDFWSFEDLIRYILTMRTINKKLAVTPFPTTSVHTEVVGGIARIKQRSELTKLKVVYNTDEYEEADIRGSEVYVRGDLCKHQIAKEVYEIEPGKPFILIDLAMVVGFEPKG